jgi:putative thioredoxin
MLGPVLDQLAASTPGVKVVKLNTDEEPEVAGAYAIRSIPAVKLFKNGQVVDEFVGAQPLGAVKSFVAAHLPKQSDPRLEEATRLIMSGDASAAEKILDALPPVMQSESEVKALRAKLYFARIALSPDETDSIQSARVAAARYLLKDDWRSGVDSLFTAAERNRRYATGAGRDDLLKAFDLNTADELALASARRRLAALLH